MAEVAAKINATITAGRLTDAEVYWRTLQPWLLESGYQLRERFQPDWTPSWLKSKKRAMSSPDGIWLFSGQLIDAVKLEDDSRVALKKFRKSVHPFEEDISKYLSSEPLASDPRNHCVPILETLYPPGDEDTVILVMPLLRAYDSPRFDTVGEVMDCFRQLFEGLQFMHERHVAHRDINANNFMLDGRNLYPSGYHPLSPKETYDLTHVAKHLTRTQLPPKYYIIDFGISRRYKPEDCPPLEPPIEGGDRTVPEFQTSDEPRDPFPTDVYYAGNFIRQQFLEGHPLLASVRGREGFEFMRPLINDMVQDDPSKRPTMNEVLQRFEEITSSLSAVRLRSRVVPRTDSALKGFLLTFPHWWRKASYIIRRLPAVPSAPRPVV
ncbi:hypothetical protein NLJ89_g6055 [Agrocybe chaxingu]|uniref:Protein kinase domain-containing protein n=1 Tax=Agrocybe chaxingu TaxID=84603 RepID=A0A9W8MV05_9AGAR|nr:hypothetical protein NLJ89_g6055 [Agrocybe chaxingu]